MCRRSVEERVVGVGDCRHSVDLEVFVGAVDSDGLNGSPIGPARLSIVEPLVAKVFHVVGIEVGNASSDFRSVNAAAH